MPIDLLLVEDDAIIAEDLRDTLARLGYRVHGPYARGEDAVAAAAAEPPDLVLMDIALAGALDGIAAADLIRARHNVPVVFLTAHGDAATLARAKLSEPFGYLVKPIPEASLPPTLEVALYRHALNERLRREKQRYETLLRTSTDAIHVFDQAGRLREWNPAFLEHLGCSAEEAAGLNIADWDAQWTAEELRAMILALIQTPARFETRHRRRDGSIREVEISATGVRLEGEDLLYASARDITARKQAEARLQRQAKLRAGLHQFALDVLRHRTAPAILQDLADRAAGLFEVPHVLVALREGARLVVRAVSTPAVSTPAVSTPAVSTPAVSTPAAVPSMPLVVGRSLSRAGSPLTWRVLETGQTWLEPDLAAETARCAPPLDEWRRLQALAFFPLQGDIEPVGVLILGRERGNPPFTEDDLGAGELLAQLAALALENAQLQAALQEQAVRDPLTGLYNRRYLLEAFGREFPRAERAGRPMSLILLDLDHFKAVNDAHGHAAGDEALRQTAHYLQAAARAGDLVCRYGGEEFLVVLDNTSLDVAYDRAETWRAGIAALAGPPALTASFGVATFPAHGGDPVAVIQAADQALYAAKAAGRNCVCVAAVE